MWSGMLFKHLVVVKESVCKVRWLIGRAGISGLKSVTKWLFGIDGRWRLFNDFLEYLKETLGVKRAEKGQERELF
ncbi:hypothetical protein [Weissella hellenica]|uniref:hypothetical protein n=1 Tax=Weissella hellenica TaxID=46256 RepID=UPI003886288E